MRVCCRSFLKTRSATTIIKNRHHTTHVDNRASSPPSRLPSPAFPIDNCRYRYRYRCRYSDHHPTSNSGF
ncbi:hypothetical protein CDV31_013900 [Fusarium ambrosium]|uniref:Uncharacterized protein n=1 Tax=Fusarium ambrosium TaxID=131363 RepID=A0A428T063_9HYPO|nr:hypothetical protein CDV31_013900 [Fusarium ambrosium]